MKENYKNNKTRIKVYGIITIVISLISISGIVLYTKGYGTVGSIRSKLVPIVDTFNKFDEVIRGGFKAKCTGKEIEVTYTNQKTNEEKKFYYKFKTEDKINYITSNYSDKDKTQGDLIAMNMIEAVYKNNGGTNKVSSKYRIASFSSISLKDGASYKSKDEFTTIDININTNILANLLALGIETIQETDYIHEEDISNMLLELENNKTYIINKLDTVVYVKDESNYFDIYYKYKDKEIMNKSLGSFIKVLKPSLYYNLYDDGNMDFSKHTDEYKINENVTFKEQKIFDSNENVNQLILFKN